MVRYLEDFEPGHKFVSGRLSVEAERIKSFAGEFDPQPFHLNEDSARVSFFNGLAASGRHTAAMTMRLLVESDFKPAGGIIGAGFDDMRWPRPVRPGDELQVESEVLEVRPSKSRPDQGLIKVRTTTLNQNNEPVQVYVGNLIVLRARKIPDQYMAKLEEESTHFPLRRSPYVSGGFAACAYPRTVTIQFRCRQYTDTNSRWLPTEEPTNSSYVACPHTMVLP